MTLSTQTFQGWYTAGILVAWPGRMGREAASARLMSSKVGKTATVMGSSDTDVAEGSLGAEPGMITDAATATGSGGIPAMLGIEGLLGKSADYPNIVCAQDLLGAVHVMTGLPWWACIASVTIAGRLLIFPLVLAQQRAAARLTAAMPEITQVENEFQAASTLYKDPGAARRRKSKLASIYAEHQCHPVRLFSTMIVTAPLFVSLFFAVKDLSDKFPAFAEVPWLWCPSLAAPDPWLLLPSAAGASLLAVLEVGLETRKASTDPTSLRLQRGIQRICCFSMVPLLVGLKYPAAVFLYWITNNLVSGVQVYLLAHPTVRNTFRLPPLPTGMPQLQPGTPQPKNPLIAFAEGINSLGDKNRPRSN